MEMDFEVSTASCIISQSASEDIFCDSKEIAALISGMQLSSVGSSGEGVLPLADHPARHSQLWEDEGEEGVRSDEAQAILEAQGEELVDDILFGEDTEREDVLVAESAFIQRQQTMYSDWCSQRVEVEVEVEVGHEVEPHPDLDPFSPFRFVDVVVFERKKSSWVTEQVVCELSRVLCLIDQERYSTFVCNMPQVTMPAAFNRKSQTGQTKRTPSWQEMKGSTSAVSVQVLSCLGVGAFGHAVLANTRCPAGADGGESRGGDGRGRRHGGERTQGQRHALKVFKVDRLSYSVVWEAFIQAIVSIP